MTAQPTLAELRARVAAEQREHEAAITEARQALAVDILFRDHASEELREAELRVIHRRVELDVILDNAGLPTEGPL